jgi:hypothetical protein
VNFLPNRRLIALFAGCILLASIAVASVAPHFKQAAGDFAVLCTAAGMRLVQVDSNTGMPSAEQPQGDAASHTLECPACLGNWAAPLPLHAHSSLKAASFAAPATTAKHFARREALTASARGPPLLHYN